MKGKFQVCKMKTKSKILIKRALSWHKIPKIIRRGIAPNSLSIVTFHGIVDKPLPFQDCKSFFEKQLKYLKDNFEAVKFSNAIILLEENKIKGLMASINFDDGYQNNFSIAFPILEKLQLPATIFLTTHFVDSQETIWFCKLLLALANTKKKILEWDNDCYPILTSKEKTQTSTIVRKKLIDLPHPELLSEVDKIVQKLTGKRDLSISNESPFKILTIKQIRELKKSGLIEFGVHTHTSKHEGFPYTLLESLACGTPAVSFLFNRTE